MLVRPWVASWQFAAPIDVFDRAVSCAVNSSGKFVVCPGRRISRTCGVRWRGCRSRSCSTDWPVGRLGGRAIRQTKLRSFSTLPTSTDLEESDLDGSQQQRGFGFDIAQESEYVASAEDEEWRSLEWDAGAESVSTSSRTEPAGFEELDTSRNFGTNVETVRSMWRPLNEEGTTAGGGERTLDGLNRHGFASGREINATEDKDVVSSAQDGLNEELPPRRVSPKSSQAKPLKSRRVNPVEGPELLAPKADVEYYVPKVGDEVIGVVVSRNAYKLDVDIGSEQLGHVLSKDVKPFDEFRSDEFFWQIEDDDASLPTVPLSQVRFLGDEESSSTILPMLPASSVLPLEESSSTESPTVPVGSVLSLQVIGVTLRGRPLLSARKIANRIAWQRVRQIREQDEPFEVQCLAWNFNSLVFKIEGLRAIMPVDQFLNKPTGQKSLKDYVGEWINILIMDVDESAGMLVVSEKRAWGWRNLRLGSLVVGTVKRILPFGVEVILNGTGLRAMVHISKISHLLVSDVSSVFSTGEQVKAVVIKSPIAHRIALSTAQLESSQGLILQDKERVFREAEEMAALNLRSLPKDESDEYHDKVTPNSEYADPHIANLDWLDFGEERGIAALGSSEKDQ